MTTLTDSDGRDLTTGTGDTGGSTAHSPRTSNPWTRRSSVLALLALAAVLYLYDLGASGTANDFYAAAVQAGTKSWKAFFFGSFDSSNFITVDKPPASLWPMEISGRIFGFNSWSMLVPQAIEGVLSVGLLYATVRRWFGHWAGLVSGFMLAITPVAVLMFRFNNPDAAMVLLIVLAAYCTTRAIEAASTKWLVIAGLVMGFSFLAKGLQPFTVVPALGIAYLIAAPASWKKRALQLLGAAAGIVVGAGWWVLAVQLAPAADRPYIGGSGDNSPLGLAFGYNGFGRLSGSTGGFGGGGGFDGSTGPGRLFNANNGGQIAWLIPAALIAAVALAIITRRAGLTDRTRAAVIMWGGWLLVTGAVLSFAGGIIHTYYTIELAPAVAALIGIGTVLLWRQRSDVLARVALAAGAVVTGIWGYTLLHRTPSFYGWLSYLLLGLGIVVAALLIVPPGVLRRGLPAAALAGGLVVLGGGSAAYAVDTTNTPHTGSTPTAGPASAGGFGGFGGRGFTGFGGRGGTGGRTTGGGGFPGAGTTGGGTTGGGTTGGGTSNGGTGIRGGFPGGELPAGFPGSGTTGGFPGGGELPAGFPGLGDLPGGARTGGFGGATTASSALVTLLKATDNTWAAATIGSMSAAPLELSSGKAVMAIGGFSGSDPAPTLAQFEADVKAGKIHYFIGSSRGGFGGRGGGTSSSISSWVSANYTATTVGGETVYDLTKAKS